MDKKTKILFLIFGALIIGSVALTFYRTMIEKDYIIEGQTDCDPTTDKCFIWKCDPMSDVEGEGCTGDMDKDIWYYQIAQRKASQIPLCDPDKDENCDPWTCAEGEKDCATIFCNDQNKDEQEAECNDPVQYNLDNPSVEEKDMCEEGDEGCTAQDDVVNTDTDGSGNPVDAAE